MTHEDAGHYAAKHPGAELDPEIEKLLKKKIIGGRISCENAHAVAGALKLSPRRVGIAIDLLEARIMDCQLGLFGSSVQMPEMPLSADTQASLCQAVKDALVKDRLPCAAAWNIAARLGVERIVVRAECERLKVKIKGCQLGAFA